MREESKQAIKEANVAVRLAPNAPLPFATRSNAHFYYGDLEAALSDINMAMKLAPEQFSLLNTRAYIHDALGDTAAALKDLNTYLEKDSAAFDALLTHAWFSRNRSLLDSAENDLHRALDMRPDDVLIQEALAEVYLRKKYYIKVVEVIEPMLESNVASAQAYSMLGLAHSKLGNPAAGLKEVNRAVKIDRYDPRFYFHRAQIYLELGKKGKACDDLFKAEAMGFSELYDDDTEELQKEACESKKGTP
ncbi:MAG: tetratricopeptide repeat protein [Bacteroidota bacterium]